MIKQYLFNKNQLEGKWYIKPLANLLTKRQLWIFKLRSIRSGIAVGTFIAFIPFPGHTIMALMTANRLNLNLPATIFGTLICNPFTIGPMFYFSYQLGAYILRLEEQNFSFSFSLYWLQNSFENVWQPLLFGTLILGLLSAFISFITADIIWKLGLANYMKKRKKLSI
jgi:hypothetical protein|tara:strand:+ start:264 stop:767 length:504 start_codon:yes stop_codon:yes gene_type:complete